MMNDNRAFASSRCSADATAVTVSLQNRLTESAEILLILPFQRVARRAKAMREDLLIPAPTVHRPLYALLHSSSTPRTPRFISVAELVQRVKALLDRLKQDHQLDSHDNLS